MERTWSNQGLPVAFALAALTLGVLISIVLAQTGSRSGAARKTLAAIATPKQPPPPRQPPGVAVARGPHYDGYAYSLAYPAGWTVAKDNARVADYAETMLESRDTSAKVTIDHRAGEVTDPAIKAAQVEAATSRTAGYRRIAFRPLTIGGRSAFEWVFTLAGARDPQRVDLFVNTGHDGFAFLAHGANVARARRAAHAIAASVVVKG